MPLSLHEPEHLDWPTAHQESVVHQLLAALDRHGLPYCLLHGHERLAEQDGSDLDVIMCEKDLPQRLLEVLRHEQRDLECSMIDWRCAGRSHFVTLARMKDGCAPIFFHLHAQGGYELARRLLLAEGDLLRGRERCEGVWAPCPPIAFVALLSRRAVKRKMSEGQYQALRRVYQRDPVRCRAALAATCGAALAGAACDAMENDAHALRNVLPALRPRFLSFALRRYPLQGLRNAAGAAFRWGGRHFRQRTGLNIVLLGPDGVGKSSLAGSIAERWSQAFAGVARRSFPPALLGRYRRDHSISRGNPHEAPLRSWMNSVARALGYWWPVATLGHYLGARRLLNRSYLVLHDRHILDVAADPRRYRYGGPKWLLRVLHRWIPKPDLVLVLDAPAAAVQQRKQEVSVEETKRQRQAYRELSNRLCNAYLIDAAGGPERVLAQAEAIIHDFLVERTRCTCRRR